GASWRRPCRAGLILRPTGRRSGTQSGAPPLFCHCSLCCVARATARTCPNGRGGEGDGVLRFWAALGKECGTHPQLRRSAWFPCNLRWHLLRRGTALCAGARGSAIKRQRSLERDVELSLRN